MNRIRHISLQTMACLCFSFAFGCGVSAQLPDSRDDSISELQQPETVTEKSQPEEAMAGIDFLHFWAIPQATRSQGIIPGRPGKGDYNYADVYDQSNFQRLYHRATDQASQQNSERMKALLRDNARLYPDKVNPTGSPFLYTALGRFQTGNFDRDYLIFQILSTLAFACGVWLIGREVGLGLWPIVAVIALSFVLFLSLIHI